ncbi:ABC transporter substrate-binding protein [Metabacillus sp. RGM 3146]|uniref:ABC transporter substrate-binding protein n=1 Tax=Metabacillus sp. RGM 3146 TaxID=3401092 RepID=UPI003B9BBC90
MRQIEHLLLIRSEFDQIPTNEVVRISIKELAGVLCSSTRNVNYLLKKMHEDKQIKWSPGKGRGHVSSLIFCYSFSELTQMYLKTMVEAQNIEDLINFIEGTTLSVKNKQVIYNYLHKELGPKIERTYSGFNSVLRMLLPQKIQTLDPIHALLYSEAHLVSHLYNTLVHFNSTDAKIEPCLAYAWKENKEGKEWTFYLRKSVQFHNNEELTAQDVKYTFCRIIKVEKDTAIYPLLSDIDEIEITDDYTVTFHLKHSNYFFPRILSSFHCSILNHTDTDLKKPNGTGPFKVSELTENFISLSAFDHYFKERALIDRIDIWMSNLIDPHVMQATKLNIQSINQPEMKISYHYLLLGSRLITFNQNQKTFDKYFKLALINLFSPKKIVQELNGNRSLPSSSFLPSKSNSDPFATITVDEIKHILSKSMYAGEMINLYYFDLNEGLESAEWLKKQAEKVGINMSLHPIPKHKPNDNNVVQEADILLLSIILSEDVELSLYTIFKSQNSFLREYLPKKAKKYIDEQLKIFQEKKAKNGLVELINIENFLKEELLIHFLYHAKNKLDYPLFLKGIEINSYGLTNFNQLWVDPDSETIISSN